MNVTTLDKRGVIRVHWRMSGVSQLDLFKFWKLFTKDNEECIEAFSYFHIGSDGLVHKIRIDRVFMTHNSIKKSKVYFGCHTPGRKGPRFQTSAFLGGLPLPSPPSSLSLV